MKDLLRAAIIIAALLCLLTCSKDPYIDLPPCGDLPDIGGEWGYIIHRDSISYYAPCFSPNNKAVKLSPLLFTFHI